MLIRREVADDVPAVRRVVAAAFQDPQDPHRAPVEVGLLDALRACPEWLPELSLVAEAGTGEVVGHVVCTRAWVAGGPVLALGPLAVTPSRQRRGVGSALVRAVLEAADALGEPLVALLGHVEYYARFGFRPAEALGIVPPQPWGAHFQVCTLAGYRPEITGAFRYAPPFDEL